MDKDECRHQLCELLNREMSCTDLLRQALNEEAAALAANDAVRLERTVTAKDGAVQQLEALEQTRQALITTAGFAGNPYGVEACIDWCDDHGVVARLWQRLLEQVELCQYQNRINGRAVEFSRRTVQHLLDILRGQLQTGRVYDPTGDTEVCADSGRTLAKA